MLPSRQRVCSSPFVIFPNKGRGLSWAKSGPRGRPPSPRGVWNNLFPQPAAPLARLVVRVVHGRANLRLQARLLVKADLQVRQQHQFGARFAGRAEGGMVVGEGIAQAALTLRRLTRAEGVEELGRGAGYMAQVVDVGQFAVGRTIGRVAGQIIGIFGTVRAALVVSIEPVCEAGCPCGGQLPGQRGVV